MSQELGLRLDEMSALSGGLPHLSLRKRSVWPVNFLGESSGRLETLNI